VLHHGPKRLTQAPAAIRMPAPARRGRRTPRLLLLWLRLRLCWRGFPAPLAAP